jgi:hypothetical protein
MDDNKMKLRKEIDEAQEMAMHLYGKLATIINKTDINQSDLGDRVIVTLRDELLTFCSLPVQEFED